MDYIKMTLAGLWNALFNLKDGYTWKALFAVLMFLSGIKYYILAVGALVIIDVATGIMAALHRGEKFSSRKLRKGLLEKMALYFILMISVFITDHLLKTVIHFDAFYLTFFVSFLMATYEVSSIAENVYVIRPDLPFLGGLVRLFKKMGEKAIAKAEDRVDDLVDEVTDVKKKISEEKEQPKDGEPKTD